jgi:hypothetical protein
VGGANVPAGREGLSAGSGEIRRNTLIDQP